MFKPHSMRKGLTTRAARKCAPLVAAVALLAGIAGAASGTANAYVSDMLPDLSMAELSVQCQYTYNRSTGLRTQGLRFYAWETQSPGMQMKIFISINGRSAAPSAWVNINYQSSWAWNLGSTYDPYLWTVKVTVLFRKWINGAYRYTSETFASHGQYTYYVGSYAPFENFWGVNQSCFI